MAWRKGKGAAAAGGGGVPKVIQKSECGNNGMKFFFGCATSIGTGKAKNEDSFTSSDDGFFMVADGHGGHQCSQFVARHIEKEVFFGAGSTEIQKSPTKALELAMTAMEQQFMKKAVAERDDSGACVLMCLLSDETISCAWVGDCRAVLYDGVSQATKAITIDHTCRRDSERQRLHQAGVPIRDSRVLGVLEPSRSIGDLDVKREGGPLGVIADAEVSSVRLTPQPAADRDERERSVLIIASDGVWGVMNDSQAMSVVLKHLKSTHALGYKSATGSDGTRGAAIQAAKDLVCQARMMGSEDDITVTVVVV